MDMDSRIKAEITKKKEQFKHINSDGNYIENVDQFSNDGPAQSHALIDVID